MDRMPFGDCGFPGGVATSTLQYGAVTAMLHLCEFLDRGGDLDVRDAHAGRDLPLPCVGLEPTDDTKKLAARPNFATVHKFEFSVAVVVGIRLDIAPPVCRQSVPDRIVDLSFDDVRVERG